ncbi:unnamed protein product [Aphis gossypii]|uniref:Ubiquitin-like protease family profile domain-containing protein n=1 Tax=Aphis gossypii TaxID=80765 RepID=A0A9P0JCA4_APHGO|nr:unnamed protein product [Aphis gossypii]
MVFSTRTFKFFKMYINLCSDEESEKEIEIKEDEKIILEEGQIKINDYKMLNSYKFINDILIDFYLNDWYTKKLSEEDRERTYVFSTHFYTTLTKSFNASDYPAHYTASQIRHGKVRRWTKNVDIFQKDFVFIPVNENKHWFLAVICFPYLSGKVNMRDGTPVNESDDDADGYPWPRITYSAVHDRSEADPNDEDLRLFDMASRENLFTKQGLDYETDAGVTKIFRRIQVKRITATLRGWLEQEYFVKHPGQIKDFSPEAIKGAALRVPQQPNYTDCGLFMIHFVEMFFKRPIVDYTFPIRHLENWFSVDEVVVNYRKRKELQYVILNRMEAKRSTMPEEIELPILDIDYML